MDEIKTAVDETLSEVAKRRSSPMIVLFDHDGKVLHVSHSVLELFQGELPIEIHGLYMKLKRLFKRGDNHHNGEGQFQEVQASEVLTIEQDNYHCRSICLSDGKEISKTKFLVMLERLATRKKTEYDLAKQIFCLSAREMDVINSLFKGYTNKEIANTLRISEPTVKGHLQIIMAKMRVTTRTGVLSKFAQL